MVDDEPGSLLASQHRESHVQIEADTRWYGSPAKTAGAPRRSTRKSWGSSDATAADSQLRGVPPGTPGMRSREESDPRGEVARLLREVREGESAALDHLLPLVYDELRQLADRQLRRERAGHTLQATALVHEAYLKLAGGKRIDATDRAHFLAIAAGAMRQVLVEYARRRKAEKRGGGWEFTTLGNANAATDFRPDEVLALDEALNKLDPRQRQVVEFRFFAGMEEKEVAAVLGVTERTVRRDWTKARAWLYLSLYPQPEG